MLAAEHGSSAGEFGNQQNFRLAAGLKLEKDCGKNCIGNRLHSNAGPRVGSDHRPPARTRSASASIGASSTPT